jgi:hypothetical protein
MKQVRMSVFETNSSSTHSLTIVTAEEFNKWKEGKVAFAGNKLVPVGTTDKWGDEAVTFDQWGEEDTLETFAQSFTTPSGDEMVAFGKYGYNG